MLRNYTAILAPSESGLVSRRFFDGRGEIRCTKWPDCRLPLALLDIVGFRQSLAATEPPAVLTHALAGLWWDAKGDWTRVRESAQQDEGVDSSWVFRMRPGLWWTVSLANLVISLQTPLSRIRFKRCHDNVPRLQDSGT
jgi:hypothetical protein